MGDSVCLERESGRKGTGVRLSSIWQDDSNNNLAEVLIKRCKGWGVRPEVYGYPRIGAVSEAILYFSGNIPSEKALEARQKIAQPECPERSAGLGLGIEH